MTHIAKLRKNVAIFLSFFSLVSNMLQPAFIAISMAPVVSPRVAYAEDSATPSASVEIDPVATVAPSAIPSAEPTTSPTASPLDEILSSPAPSATPIASPLASPTATPEPSPAPSESTTTQATNEESTPTPEPSATPLPSPTANASYVPTVVPTPSMGEMHAVILPHVAANSVEIVDLTINEEGSATLTTDKADYAPTDTALITGAGFESGDTYSLTISSTDDPATSTTVSVTADSEGKIFYAYQLDGNYRPNYKVEANDAAGRIVATITFTDSREVVSITVNGSSSVTVYPDQQVTVSVTVNTDWWWYGDDDWRSTAWRLGNGSWTCVDHANHNSQGSHNESFSITSPLSDGTYDLQIRAYNNDSCTSGQSDTKELKKAIKVISIPYTPVAICHATHSSTNPFVSETPANAGQLMGHVGLSHQNGEDIIPPIPNLLPLGQNWDAAGQAIWNNGCNPAPRTGTIKVIKSVTNNNGGTKQSSDFALFVNQNSVTTGVANTYAPGTYTITETQLPGYSQSSLTCDHGKSNPVNLQAGENITCTITNDDQPGTLIIKKVVSGGSKKAQDFSFSVNNAPTIAFEADGQNELTVNAGTYNVTEPSDSVYATSYSNCSNISMGLGETKTCTITNVRKTGRILIDKILFDGPAKESDWDFTIGGISGLFKDGSFVTLDTGSYTISESGSVLGYSLAAVGGACSNKNGNAATLTVTPTQGEDYNTCTFTNTRDTGSVRVNKQVDLNGDGDYYDYNEQSNTVANNLGFAWQIDGGSDHSMGSTQNNIPTTIPGVTHTITENSVSGYHLVGWSTNGSCRNPNTTTPITVTVNKGQLATVTLCNARDMGTVTIVKQATNQSDQNFSFETNLPGGHFELEDDGNDHNGGTEESRTWTVPVGAYTVTENVTPGWKLTYISCDTEGQWGVGDDKRSVRFDVIPGRNITCTFHNTQLGKIIGQKYHDKNADGNRDWFELGLASWQIFIDQNDNQIYDVGEPMQVTSSNHHSYGWYEFANLSPGDYTVCETMQGDWHNGSPLCQTTRLTPGDIDSLYFGNYQDGSITVRKDVITYDGRPISDESGTEFMFHIPELEASFALADGASHTTAGVRPGTYHIREDVLSAYDFAGCSIADDHRHDHEWDHEDRTRSYHEHRDDTRVVIGSGEDVTLVCRNKQRTGDLMVTKYNDLNGDGVRDENEPTLSGWQINLSGEESRTTGEDGTTTFSSLLLGTYNLSETIPEGSDWKQTNIVCDDIREDQKKSLSQEGYSVYVAAGTTTHCSIGNQQKPILRVQKSNNATGTKNHGDIVTYTMVVDLSGSSLTGVSLTDVTPEGFEYVAGSWTSSKAGVSEPNYGSPGVWNLGDMVPGDVITLTYQAKIGDSLDSGTYKDLAWANGTNASYGNILALGHDSTYVDDIFVGTDVTVSKDTKQTGQVNIEREGEVLGASTELPATGPSSAWLLIAMASLLGGILLIFGKKSMKKSLLLAIVAIPLFSAAPRVVASDPDNNLSVRLEQPSSPTRMNDWKLSYSVLDRLSRTPVVTCYVKKPGEGSFVSFDASHTSVKPEGDNYACHIDGSVMSNQGDYQFYVSVVSGSDSENSQTMTVNYDTNGPGTPGNYSKEHPSMCRWIIKFHTANDSGATSKVEIYSSDKANFATDNGTRVGSIDIGSDQGGTFIHDRADGCDKEWYYVIRAYDVIGNQSAHIGDEITRNTVVAPSPVAGAVVITKSAGSVLGKTDDHSNSTESGEVLGEVKDVSGDTTSNPGRLASTTNAVKNLVTNKFTWWILSILVALGIVYGIARKKIFSK